jgi:hypothetical protein
MFVSNKGRASLNAVELVVCGGREGRAQARRGTRAPACAVIVRISVFVEIKQQISCGITTIMVRAAMPTGQTGRNGHARPGAEAGSA